ncbi:hypothetical protein BVY04_02660 [bacterium M21]|nr:hypothetical protein BVY04_02660 [bacterium M21]
MPLYIRLLAICTISVACFVLPTMAQDWNNWRGPDFSGAAQAKNLPIQWSIADKTNIKWDVRLPGPSGATPIISGDLIFVSSSVTKSGELRADCFNRHTGKAVWSKRLGAGGKAKRGNAYASPSPVTDGKSVIFTYANGIVVSYNLTGEKQWERNLVTDYGKLDVGFIYSASPLLLNNRLIFSVLRRDRDNQDSYVLALDARTGKSLWKHARKPLNTLESMESYTSPIPFTLGEKVGVIVSGAGYISCHVLQTGAEMWRFVYAKTSPKNWRLVPTPVQAGNQLIFSLPRGGHMMSIQCPKNDLSQTPTLAWEHKGSIPDVPSSTYKDGHLYVMDDKKRNLTCFNGKTGAVIWTEKLEFKPGVYASPTLADGKIYCIGLRGEVAVFSAGSKPKRLASFTTDKDIWSSPVAVGNNLYIRAPQRLICVGK